jgi:predicted nucleic acid-binding protein
VTCILDVRVTYILDACAIIAYFKGEEGGDKLVALMEDETSKILMHYINLGEVYYNVPKVDGKEEAERMIDDVFKLPIEFRDTISIELLREAGQFKTTYKISYADSFVLAPAKLEGGEIVTTDHREFDQIEEDRKASFYWLR